jgi:hypothetical protein
MFKQFFRDLARLSRQKRLFLGYSYRVAAVYTIAAGFLIRIAAAAFPNWQLPNFVLDNIPTGLYGYDNR